jgi:hypothetical protein
MGKEKVPWLSTDWVLSQFGKGVGTARARYSEFVAEGIGEGRREEFHVGSHEGRLLGDDHFVSGVLDKTEAKTGRPPSLGLIVAQVCREGGLSERPLRAPGKESRAARARWMVGLVSMEHKSASLTEVARYFGRDVTTISNGVRQLRERTTEDTQFRQQMNRIERRLIQNTRSKAPVRL